VAAATARARLLGESHNRLDVQVVANPAERARGGATGDRGRGRPGWLIALANLLTATVVGLRDHRHEVGVLARPWGSRRAR
jgi:hypothetical protein